MGSIVLSDNNPLIDTRWIFGIEGSEIGELAKTRLVAQDVLMNTPVVDITVVRTTPAVACEKNLKVTRVDVETAFL